MASNRALTTRRAVIASASAGGLVALSAGAAGQRATAAATPLRADPFTLGVASGDPGPDGFVLWTRLAPDPLADDGRGGMAERFHEVRWEVAVDERFGDVVRRGRVYADPAGAHAVHVEVAGLAPDREYHYRFRTGRWTSRAGRTRTAPAPGAMPSALAMSFVSCAQLEHGFFTGYRRLAEDRPDLVLHLGDYLYEYQQDVHLAPGGNVRDHRGPETATLAGYRQRYAQYKLDLDLQEAHAAAPWLVVWDDHEVENNWAAGAPEEENPSRGFAERRAAAFRAYYENMPLRRRSVPSGVDMQVFRRLRWGRLATFHMLDTRQHRDDQACSDGDRVDHAACPEAGEPTRTMLGSAQESWLLDGYRRSAASGTRWDVLGQQVFLAPLDLDPGPATVTSMDTWSGYPAARDRLLGAWRDAAVRNPVVLTGDVHSHWAAEVPGDPGDPSGRPVATELVCSSVSSGGDGADAATGGHETFAANPHLRFFDDQRGYVRTTIRTDRTEIDFRSLAYVSRPGAPARTRRSYVIEDGDPTLHLTADRPTISPSAASG